MQSYTAMMILVALATVGAVLGADHAVRLALARQIALYDDRLSAGVLAVMDERITDARMVLADLASAHQVDCAPSAHAARAEAVVASAEVADIAVVDATGTTVCSTLPVPFDRAGENAIPSTALGPLETIETTVYGPQRVPALLLRHSLAPSGALVAILPYARLIAGAGALSDSPSLRILYGPSVVYASRAGNTGSMPQPEAASGAMASEDLSSERAWIERADTAYFPLRLAMETSDRSIGWDHPVRLTVDIAAGAVAFSLGTLLFLRRRGVRRLAATIDRAIRRNEFEPLFRPVIDLESGRIAAVRIEVMWTVGRKRLSPEDYQADVRSARLDLKLLRSALVRSRQSLAQAFKLRPRLLLKVPVEFETLQRPQFADVIRRAMAGSGIRLSQVVICVPPVMDAHDAGRAFGALKTLQALGIGIELMDTSSAVDFAYKAERLPASSVSLDRRLYGAIGGPESDDAARARLWVAQLVEAARASATRVCAYDVSDEVTLKALKSLGVREAEGTLIVPALTAATLMTLVVRAGIEWNDLTEAGAVENDVTEKQTA